MDEQDKKLTRLEITEQNDGRFKGDIDISHYDFSLKCSIITKSKEIILEKLAALSGVKE